MSQTTTSTPAKEYPAALKSILERAHAGDPSALPDLKKAFDEYPELVAHFGDLARHARECLLTLAAGPSLTAREAISRQVEGLRSRLAGEAATELEKLLVDRICICWLEVHHGDVSLAGHLLRGVEASQAAQAAQKRLDRAHARFLSSVKTLATVRKLVNGPGRAGRTRSSRCVKTLATVRKLVKPPVSPLDLLARPAADTATAGANSPRGRGLRVPAIG